MQKDYEHLYLFTVIAACCLFITGCPEPECTVDCPQPEDVECHDLSVLALESTIICTDGNELKCAWPGSQTTAVMLSIQCIYPVELVMIVTQPPI